MRRRVALGSWGEWGVGGAFEEKGRKAGVSSEASEASSEAEERRASWFLGFGFWAGKRGRRVNARLWERGGGSDEEEEDGEVDLALGEGDRGAMSPCWWRSEEIGGRVSPSWERRDGLDRCEAVIFRDCGTTLLEPVREYAGAVAN